MKAECSHGKLLPSSFSGVWKSRAEHLQVAALDLDDTLLTREKEIDSETQAALRAWLDSGREIVIATGRPPRLARAIPEFLQEHPRICYNGAWLEHRQQVIYRNPIPAREAQQFMEQLYSAFPNLWMGFESDDVYYMSKKDPYRPAIICDLRCLARPAYKIVLKPSLMEESQLEIIENIRPKGTTWLRSGLYDLVQIASHGTDKSVALEWWLNSKGLSVNQALAIGDDTNDTGMVSTVGLGIAMANAVDSVKETADFITSDNLSGGVARVLNRVMATRR